MHESGFPGDTSGKETNCQCWVRSLGWEDPLEQEMATHSSRESPWTEEPGGLQPIVLHRIGHEWSNLAHTHNAWIKDEITKKLRKYFILNNKEYTQYQNLWDAAKDVLR